jgi:hypothetical protein
MNCKHIRTAICAQGYRTDRLDATCRNHLTACELCRAWYRDEVLQIALTRSPVPEPDAGFVDRVLAHAVAAPPRPRSAPHWAAAGLVMVLGSILTIALGLREPPIEAGLVERFTEVRTVRVVINSTARREDATVTIRLAEDLELEGYPGLNLLEWQTDLERGRNLLTLPVRSRSSGAGEIRVAVSYDGTKQQEMRIEIGA